MRKIYLLVIALAISLTGCAGEAPQVSQARADEIRIRAMTDAALQMSQATSRPAASDWLGLVVVASFFVFVSVVILATCAFLYFVLRPKETVTKINLPAPKQPEKIIERVVVFLQPVGRGQYRVRDENGSHMLGTEQEDIRLLEALK